jgi:hypothetical protein
MRVKPCDALTEGPSFPRGVRIPFTEETYYKPQVRAFDSASLYIREPADRNLSERQFRG